MIRERSETFLSIKKWKEQLPGLTAVFSTKNGGFSEKEFASLNTGMHVQDDESQVIQNRNKLGMHARAPIENWVCAEQVHGSIIKKVHSKHKGRGTTNYFNAIPGTDGLWTFETNLFLSLCFADCVPLYFAEPDSKFIGVAHAGWKGTVQNIAGKMIQQAIENKVDPARIQIYIGPSIGKCCYEVNDAVANQVQFCLNRAEHSSLTRKVNGKYNLDLKQLNKQLLLDAGIKEDQISLSSSCTSCEKELFFSHRRDHGKTGRMSAVLGWRE
ncbi:peptidoglycan editing factor PgeF [Jeotgalibacillus sp. ET6]|uniref:peptidoglycan editing factor PgeF n=1 Tax=Jeotgalibacillus sp. ET6 TaxID=3037260 RepID=UPI0024182F68|nr:peptidoglycan editing factor PgeF [Jeotgalibacillus sp. ET6]MDG5470212.1 peptidoglycan editing factor PgeF [Jeotgalibacillus sp. ET6]